MFYTPQEVADMLQVNKHFVYRQIKDDKLQAYQVGRFYRIDQSDLRVWIESMKIGAKEA